MAASKIRQRRRRWLAPVVAAVGLSYRPAVRAELAWTQKTIELDANSKAAVREARFQFTNNGSKPVDIGQVQSSCGCTTVVLARRHFDPGASGEIVARFAVGERVGLQKKMILVSTSDSPVPTELTLVVRIPELVRFEPAFVTWNQGEPCTAKTIGIEFLHATPPLQHITVRSSSLAVTTHLELLPDSSGKYQISVTPATTQQPLFATLTIRCRIAGEDKVFHAFAGVEKVVQPPKVLPPADSAAR